jgi:hypothetical protein
MERQSAEMYVDPFESITTVSILSIYPPMVISGVSCNLHSFAGHANL